MARGMIEANPAQRFILIFGARYRGGLLYHDEWELLARDFPNFEYRPTITRPEPGWAGLTGRVQPHVFEALAGRRDLDVYICGLREMVDDLRTQLKEAGLDRKRIVYERYD
jgi:CDP-4-dehydro-6-deoxyglucose reductase